MKNLRTKFAAVVIAAAAFTAVPAAAMAYTPGAPDTTVAGSPVPGGVVTLQALAFDVNVTISFVVTGENGAAITQAVVRSAVSSSPTFTATTNASGNASLGVRLPANASGAYTVAATGLKNGVVVTETSPFSVAGGGLPATGIDAASMTGVWIGGGALLAAGVAVTSVAVIRRRQAEQV